MTYVSTVHSRHKNADFLTILLQECKRQQMTLGKDPFITELRCVLRIDWQLQEIEQFCPDLRASQYLLLVQRLIWETSTSL